MGCKAISKKLVTVIIINDNTGKAAKNSVALVLLLTMGLFLVACGETANSPTLTAPAATLTVTSHPTTVASIPTEVAATPTNPAIALATVTPQPQPVPTVTAAITAVATTVVPVTTIAAPTLVNSPPTTALATTVIAPTVPVPTTQATTNTAASSPTDTTAANPSTTIIPVQTSQATISPATATPAVIINAVGKLAYVESGNLYIYDFSSQSKSLLYEATGTSGVIGIPAWSADNSHIVITLKENVKNPASRSNLYLLNLIGGEPQRITTSGLVATSEESPVWSPDGRYIAFTEILDPNRTNVFNATNAREVWLADANGQNPHKIADGLEAAWSEDSTSLVYITNGNLKAGATFRQNNAIHLVKIGSSNSDREVINIAKIPSDLTNYGVPFGSDTTWLQYPVFLSNDKVLGFTTLGYSGLVATISTTGSELKLWDANPEGGFGRTYADPAKGNRLMYEAYPPSGITHIYIIDVNTSPLPLRVNKVNFGSEKIKESANNPNWSPDSSMVAYLYQNGDSSSGSTTGTTNALAIATSQATKPQTLARGILSAVAWSN